jgi:hypothetical protein
LDGILDKIAINLLFLLASIATAFHASVSAKNHGTSVAATIFSGGCGNDNDIPG